MSRDAALARGRAAAEAGMVDRCTITVQTGTQLDEVSGREVPTTVRVYPAPGSPATDGPCEVIGGGTIAHNIDAAGQALTTQASELRLPIGSSGAVPIRATATITHAEHDPQLVGVKLRVTGPFHQSFATSRRLAVEEIA